MEISFFLLQELEKQYGAEAERIIAGFQANRKTTLRVNKIFSSREEVLEAVDAAGIEVKGVPWSEDAFVVEGAREEALMELPLYKQGKIYLQSLSSMIPPIVLGVQPGENVLDMAAAPGGKTTQIASLTGNGAMITACERNKARAERLRYNLEKQGATHVNVMNMDARQLDDFFRFDKILLDAPCSGSGTVSEGFKGRFSEEYLNKTAKIQKTMLEKAFQLLRPGHEMVYSTCSVLQKENEDVVRSVLKKGAEIVAIPQEEFNGIPLLPTTLEGTMCVCPNDEYEGFFVAKLKKK